MFRGVWELQPRRLSPEPPLCFQLQAQLLKSRVHLTSEDHQPACPPTNINSPNTMEFSGREETKAEKQNRTVHFLSASSHRGKYLLFPPASPKTSPPRDPDLARCSTPGSSPTLETVS
ncbi:hypothetical protein AMECASPLE_020531 [Ameca splendens]|uniref:Uncharacterized protein n=1 Tax=Ameca splendens TaxID=208324 RepID=A0ABV0ZPF5_9TELE